MTTIFWSTADFEKWALGAGLEESSMLQSLVRGNDPDFLENSFKVYPIQHERPIVHLLRVCVGPIAHYQNRFYKNGDVAVQLPSKTWENNVLSAEASANSKGTRVLFMVSLYETDKVGEVPVAWTSPYIIGDLAENEGGGELVIHPCFANRAGSHSITGDRFTFTTA